MVYMSGVLRVNKFDTIFVQLVEAAYLDQKISDVVEFFMFQLIKSCGKHIDALAKRIEVQDVLPRHAFERTLEHEVLIVASI